MFFVVCFSNLLSQLNKTLSFYNTYNNELLHCKAYYFYVILQTDLINPLSQSSDF